MLVLASASPRRSALLQEWGFDFCRVHAPVAEDLPAGIIPEKGVRELAGRKAFAGYEVWKSGNDPAGDIVLGADTMVVLDRMILGKPRDERDAEKMLLALSGKTHRVMTAIALAGLDNSRNLQIETDVEMTTVSFRNLSRREILDYIASGEPMDKAAAYGIQGEAGKFAIDVQGSFTNVIGLPMELLTRKLKERGIFPNR